MKRNLIPVATLASAVLLSVLAGPAGAAPEPAHFEARALDGSTLQVPDAGGRVVLVHFWATWCANCREEMIALESYVRERTGQPLLVLAPSLDRTRDLDEVRSAMKGLSFPATMARAAKVNSFGIPAVLPVTYVVDRKGDVVATLRPDGGAVTLEALERVVDPLLR